MRKNFLHKLVEIHFEKKNCAQSFSTMLWKSIAVFDKTSLPNVSRNILAQYGMYYFLK